MEVTLKFLPNVLREHVEDCFNPCYSGSNSKIIGASRELNRRINVSILVIVEVTLKYQEVESNLTCNGMFQSLL